MADTQILYDRANKIANNIVRIKSITQQIVDDRENGIKIDKKEVLNIALDRKWMTFGRL
jgi:hypothetical protein